MRATVEVRLSNCYNIRQIVVVTKMGCHLYDLEASGREFCSPSVCLLFVFHTPLLLLLHSTLLTWPRPHRWTDSRASGEEAWTLV